MITRDWFRGKPTLLEVEICLYYVDWKRLMLLSLVQDAGSYYFRSLFAAPDSLPQGEGFRGAPHSERKSIAESW